LLLILILRCTLSNDRTVVVYDNNNKPLAFLYTFGFVLCDDEDISRKSDPKKQWPERLPNGSK
jgi:hypothetical protein